MPPSANASTPSLARTGRARPNPNNRLLLPYALYSHALYSHALHSHALHSHALHSHAPPRSTLLPQLPLDDLPRIGDATDDEQARLVARFCLRSVTNARQIIQRKLREER